MPSTPIAISHRNVRARCSDRAVKNVEFGVTRKPALTASLMPHGDVLPASRHTESRVIPLPVQMH